LPQMFVGNSLACFLHPHHWIPSINILAVTYSDKRIYILTYGPPAWGLGWGQQPLYCKRSNLLGNVLQSLKSGRILWHDLSTGKCAGDFGTWNIWSLYKMDLRKTGWEGVEWTDLAPDRDQ
jgi:hypothetical protein